MPAVESAHRREYKLRDIAKAGLKAALRVLPEGYARFTRMLRQHAAYSWRDPDGRFHLIIVHPKTGMPSIVSFWADELQEMLKDSVLHINGFRLDPHMTTRLVAKLDARGRLPDGWREEALNR